MALPSNSPSADAPSDLDWYRLVRSQIEFESGLIAQRLSWFVAAQSFLFSAYAISLNAPRDPAVAEYGAQQRLVYHLIPVVAIASCLLIYLGMLGALFAQAHLRRFLHEKVSQERLALFPALQGMHQTHVMGLVAPLGLPLVFVAVWVYLFTHGLV